MTSFKILLASNMMLVSLLFMIMKTVFGATSLSGDFSKAFDITWGKPQILDGGKLLNLNLDKSSGSGFRSKNEFLLGRIDMQIKLVPGNSAGTVTTYYLSSEGPNHDEVDFEFLGNASGQPYTLHTNVFSRGKGNREQQFRLWFDPTKSFNTYSVLWNRKNIIFYVNNIPIRVFNNMESLGVPYPNKQPMKIYATLWNGEDWATQGGKVKIDWSKAPFSASYSNFKINACVINAGKSSCDSKTASSDNLWLNKELDDIEVQRLRWAQRRFRIYNYCNDLKRFPHGLPIECKKSS